MRERGQEMCYFLQCGNCDSLAVVIVAHRGWLASKWRADDCLVWFVASGTSVYHRIRQLVVNEFFQQGLIFLENDKNCFPFVFTVLPKHIKIKSPLKYKSVAEWLSLQASVLLYHHITAPLCRYQFDRLPSLPGTPGLLHRNVCPAPGLLGKRKFRMSGL